MDEKGQVGFFSATESRGLCCGPTATFSCSLGAWIFTVSTYFVCVHHFSPHFFSFCIYLTFCVPFYPFILLSSSFFSFYSFHSFPFPNFSPNAICWYFPLPFLFLSTLCGVDDVPIFVVFVVVCRSEFKISRFLVLPFFMDLLLLFVMFPRKYRYFFLSSVRYCTYVRDFF